MKLALHTCCGPCASSSVPAAKAAGHEVTMVFANSNIDTAGEFDLRFKEAEKVARAEKVEIVRMPYDHDDWLKEVASGLEYEPECGERCRRCFEYNLRKTAEYASDSALEAFATTLSVSPHKRNDLIFAAGAAAETGNVKFSALDFKKAGGYARSVERSKELGLYRQNYCGCEFSRSRWKIHHKKESISTNLDAIDGKHRDVFTAEYQSAGRGRLDHKWHSPAGAGLLMSAVLSVENMNPADVSTLPLVAGLSVAKALETVGEKAVRALAGRIQVKWPNDVWVDGRKIAGILCERHADNVIIGIGVNVADCERPAEVLNLATSIEQATGSLFKVTAVRDAVLGQLWKWYGIWRTYGFAPVLKQLSKIDALKGRRISVLKVDSDTLPVTGISSGIDADGSLLVDGVKVYAGEAHVLKEGEFDR